MPTGYQIKDQTAAYYLTFQGVFWIDIFAYSKYRDIIIDSLKFCQKDKGLEIFAWAIMSNHIHLLARSSKDDLSGTIRDFKKYTSKAIIEMIETSGDSRKEWMLRLFRHAARRQNKDGQNRSRIICNYPGARNWEMKNEKNSNLVPCTLNPATCNQHPRPNYLMPNATAQGVLQESSSNQIQGWRADVRVIV
jgi:REP element-mobilizing transposase RayT